MYRRGFPPRASSKKQRQRILAVHSVHVTDLDNQKLMAEPDFTRLPDFEPPNALLEESPREQAKYVVDNEWRWDPVGWSVKAAENVPRDPDTLSQEEYCGITKAKLTKTRKVRNLAWLEYARCRRQYEWLKNKDVDDIIFNLDSANLHQELDEFYGSEGTDLRPVRDETDDEGFSEPNAIATTVVTLPDKSLLEPGVTPGGIFQDSGIVIDKDYVEYSRAHSRPDTANPSAEMLPNNWPTFHANVAAVPTKKRRPPPLGLVGDMGQHDWPGRRQGPYGVDGLRSWVRASEKASKSAEVQETPNDIPSSTTGTEDSKAAEAVPHLVTQECPQHLDGSNESVHDNGPSVNASDTIQTIPQFEVHTDTHARRNTPSTAAATPVNQRFLQVEQVRVDTPATPAMININLTPEYNSDVEDASDDSLEVHLPNSPTPNTQKWQSALGRYVQATTPHPDTAHPSSSNISIAGSQSEVVSLVPTQEHPSQPEGHAGFTKGVELHQKKNDAVFTLGSPKASQATPSSIKPPPVPITPAKETHTTSFHPTTPFQLNTPARNQDFTSPGTPTPAPKDSTGTGKSVKNIFKSAKLATRSPERTQPSPDFVVAPFIPTAGTNLQTRDSPFGSQGLLFNKTKKNEKNTMNVLNSLKLSPAQGSGNASGSFAPETLDDSEDELASQHGVGASQGGNQNRTPEPKGLRSGKSNRKAGFKMNVAQAVVVPSVRRRGRVNEGQSEDGLSGEPKMKKQRRSLRGKNGSADAGPGFEQ